ncbi:MAG: hydrogenase nickel incorporation protein HypA [Acidobacteriota bacterium]|nr:hydrogenase nickel incorporation protein HypA [Acidobacteriota bacterium]
MHELALADAVVTSALAAAEREQLREVTRIAVRIGELQQIDKDVFKFALEQVMPSGEPRLAGTSFTLETVPARFRCRACNRGFTRSETGGSLGKEEAEAIHFLPELAHAFLRCPGCDSGDFAVQDGRGVSIAYIEGE